MKIPELCLAFVALLLAQVGADTIECPYPEGSSVDSEEECGKYTSCTWATSGCQMQDYTVAGYYVASEQVDTGRGFTVALQKIDPSITMFDQDVSTLTFEVIYHEYYHVQIKIYDSQSDRYEVPLPIYTPTEADSDPLYLVTVSAIGTPLTFSVARNSSASVVFQSVGALTFEDQFIQFTASLTSSFVYGFGEQAHTRFRHSFESRVTTPLFSRDQPVSNDDYNQYGVHPYYVNVEDDDGNTNSVLFYNSNAMEYSTFSLDDGSPAITYRTIGGIIDLHFFLGPTPEEVNKQYATAIGVAAMPPYWALGFQLSRYGYNSLENLKIVRQRMKDAGIPQDVQTCDIDYMYLRQDFTYDTDAWAGFPEYIEEMHDDGLKVTLILDPALITDYDSYSPSVNGLAQDVFIKWMDPSLVPSDQEEADLDYMVGFVWPEEKTVFPDFMKPETRDWWVQECQTLHETLSFDAIWIDMNEPSNFGTNLDRPFNYPSDLPDWSLKCPYNSYDSPPFPTKATYQDVNECQRLSDKTICMSGMQTNGTHDYIHYDVHSLYGYGESVATYQALEAIFPEKRHLVYSRSTYPGSGKYVSHWLGDNTANWEQLRKSIVGMLEFNLFVIPNVGADICGFFDEPSEELCARWMQLGAFYPFSRNHNTIGTADQDPAREDWPIVNSVSREVLLLRYKYLPYLYTLFQKANHHGFSIIRPLFNIFPSDLDARDVDDQFFWGDSMMIAPVLYESAVSRDVYFPEGLWYSLVGGTLDATGPVTLTIDAPIDEIPIYIRGGAMLPSQEPEVTTALSRLNDFDLTIALDEFGTAWGDLYYDDGESVIEMKEGYMCKFDFANNVLNSTIKHGEEAVVGLYYRSFVFYGYPSNPASINVNGDVQDSSAWSFDASVNVLNFTANLPLNETFIITFS